jgi:hypothetical protein
MARTKKEPIQEYASLRGVKLFKPGRHNNIEFDEQALDVIAASSNACHKLILESIGKTEYDGNPQIDLNGKPIPALLNLNHQSHLAETIKDAVKYATAKFYTTIDKGIKYLMADFENVPADIAMFLKEKFPKRSIELIPWLEDPQTHIKHPYVIRSVGFLDDTMPPAVTGLDDNFVVAFSQIQTFSLDFEENPTQENRIMEEKQEATTPESLQVSLVEFQEVKNALEQAKKDAEITRLLLEKERQTRERAEIQMFCEKQMNQGTAPAYFPKEFTEFVLKLDNSQVIEFTAEVKKTPRQWFLDYIAMFAKHVPGREEAPGLGKQPMLTREAQRLAKVQEFTEQAKTKATNPKDEREVYFLAYQEAITRAPELFE